jgi:hypothetical protein
MSMLTIRNTISLFAATLITLANFASSVSAAPIVLDDFQNNPGTWNPVTAPGVLQNNADRTLTLGVPGLQNGGDFLGVGGGQFSFQSNTISTYSASLEYSFGPVALSGANNLALDFLSIDAGSTLVTDLSVLMEVITSTGTLSQAFLLPEGNFPQSFLLSFAGLAGAGDLASTIGLRLTFNNVNDAGVDFILTGDDGVRITNGEIPEPATLATFGLMGLVGGIVARRKLKARALVSA